MSQDVLSTWMNIINDGLRNCQLLNADFSKAFFHRDIPKNNLYFYLVAMWANFLSEIFPSRSSARSSSVKYSRENSRWIKVTDSYFSNISYKFTEYIFLYRLEWSGTQQIVNLNAAVRDERKISEIPIVNLYTWEQWHVLHHRSFFNMIGNGV